ncbi:hypothetical protein AB6A40_007387 [Gnathostoma spinigerum]|uniref:Uncharacterized protein n=1 Tax=Gnathostoma spinigerum TaxID=75299 RepID=A0ABD6EL26_9BILA
MGCMSSSVFHDDELGIDDRELQYLNYTEQPFEEYNQLDTENDQRGDTAVEHIFKKTRLVYGQPPLDLRGRQFDWAEYGIVFKDRPCPYDFPAFENDRPPDYDQKKNEAAAATQQDKMDVSSLASSRKSKKGKKAGKDKNKQKKSPGKKDKSKSKKDKKGEGGQKSSKKRKRLSAQAVGECSISE